MQNLESPMLFKDDKIIPESVMKMFVAIESLDAAEFDKKFIVFSAGVLCSLCNMEQIISSKDILENSDFTGAHCNTITCIHNLQCYKKLLI
jgi:hypothetical protein